MKLFRLVKATDGAFVFVRVRTMFHVDLGGINIHIHTVRKIKKRAISYMLHRGQVDDTNSHFFQVSKATTRPRYKLQQQQRYNNTTAPIVHTLAFVTAEVLCVHQYNICVLSVHQEVHASMFTFPHSISKSNARRRTSSWPKASSRRQCSK